MTNPIPEPYPIVSRIDWQNILLFNKALILFFAVISITNLAVTGSFFGIGISMFISILTLIFMSVVVGLVTSQWHLDILSTSMLNKIMVRDNKIQWKHIQYTYSVIFGCFNFLSFILLAMAADKGYSVFLPGISALLTTNLFTLEAMVAFRMDAETTDDYVQI